MVLVPWQSELPCARPSCCSYLPRCTQSRRRRRRRRRPRRRRSSCASAPARTAPPTGAAHSGRKRNVRKLQLNAVSLTSHTAGMRWRLTTGEASRGTCRRPGASTAPHAPLTIPLIIPRTIGTSGIPLLMAPLATPTTIACAGACANRRLHRCRRWRRLIRLARMCLCASRLARTAPPTDAVRSWKRNALVHTPQI